MNYRPTWDFANTNLRDANENITGNYYPVNSAVSMQDGDKLFTVMNDRSQGASALKEGTIEFMQNRRNLGDDGKGMGEGSNEMDENGNGIRVVASYQVAIGKDVQRQVQMRTMSPPQYFFSFDQDTSISNLIDS